MACHHPTCNCSRCVIRSRVEVIREAQGARRATYRDEQSAMLEEARRSMAPEIIAASRPRRPGAPAGTPQLNSTNPYEVLGLARGAAPSVVRKRYLELALRYHPDKRAQRQGMGAEVGAVGDDAAFQKISHAFRTISG